VTGKIFFYAALNLSSFLSEMNERKKSTLLLVDACPDIYRDSSKEKVTKKKIKAKSNKAVPFQSHPDSIGKAQSH
jgi:predicted flavoprotein YhiN